MSEKGIVFNIQRFSIHDGPGIRTTVFLKGCPLSCEWCHNPEGLEYAPQIRLAVNLCQLCGRCVEACELGGHEITEAGHQLHLEPCIRCSSCVEACLVGAVELVGKEQSVAEVIGVVVRDKPFYEHSGGGMTLSGGEPLAQYEFSKALLVAARAEGLHTAVETSALAPWHKLEELSRLVDLWLVDLKHTDSARHKELCGVPNELILDNIRKLAATGWPMILRVPWVPERNAEESFLEGLKKFLATLDPAPEVEFMLYHRLGNGKWLGLGGEPVMPDDIPNATAEDVIPWIEQLASIGVHSKTS